MVKDSSITVTKKSQKIKDEPLKAGESASGTRLDIERIASIIPEVLFVAEQDDKDTIKKPTSSGTVFLAGDASFDQEAIIAENQEKRNTYDEQEGKLVGYKMGTFSFPINLKVSGTAGTAPPGAPLLKSLMGRETVDPGVDVRYQHYRRSDELVWLTLLWQGDLETYLIKGAVCDKGKIDINADLVKLDLSGFFCRKYEAGFDETPSAIDGTGGAVTTIPLTHSAMNFDIGAYIVVGSDDNSGAGFEITGKDEGAKTLTIADGVTTLQPAGSIVCGWAPLVQDAGDDLVGIVGDFKTDKSGSLAPFDILSATLEIANGFKASELEKSGSSYPRQVSRGKRTVTFNWDEYECVENLDIKKFVERYSSLACEINIGETSGSIIQVPLPNFKPDKAPTSGSEEKKHAISGKCHPSTGDDTCTLIFK